jgi:hypothetical protein
MSSGRSTCSTKSVEEPNRSAFIEKAARKYLEDAARAVRRQRDAAILLKCADRLNEEAADVLEYQSIPN